jgi:hypothetical protein
MYFKDLFWMVLNFEELLHTIYYNPGAASCLVGILSTFVKYIYIGLT